MTTFCQLMEPSLLYKGASFSALDAARSQGDEEHVANRMYRFRSLQLSVRPAMTCYCVLTMVTELFIRFRAGMEWGYNKRKVTETNSLSRGYSSLGVDCKF